MFITRLGIFPARDCRGGSSERVSECTTFYTVTINNKSGRKDTHKRS